MSNFQDYVDQVCQQVREASYHLATVTGSQKNQFLADLANNLTQHQDQIIKQNQLDLDLAQENHLSTAMIDRLSLNAKRISDLAYSLNDILALPDPVGEITQGSTRPNGIEVQQIRTPLGVVMVIYESRPNVTIDIAALGIKSGNAVILRGGKEAFHTNQYFAELIRKSLQSAGLPEESVTVIKEQDREVVKLLLQKDKEIDVVVPRGGKALIKMVSEKSSIPVIKHDEGLCHLYLEADAPLDRSVDLIINSKVQRPGVCNAIETLLVHQDFPYLKEVFAALSKVGVEIRVDESIRKNFPEYKLATNEDWRTEYLDLILSVKQVSDLASAMNWISRYGSGHTEVIVTNDLEKAHTFQLKVDASAVVVNTSSRFNDGSMLGLGTEVGTSTQKLHVRGPMGIRDLTCLKYRITGQGQVRT